MLLYRVLRAVALALRRVEVACKIAAESCGVAAKAAAYWHMERAKWRMHSALLKQQAIMEDASMACDEIGEEYLANRKYHAQRLIEINNEVI